MVNDAAPRLLGASGAERGKERQAEEGADRVGRPIPDAHLPADEALRPLIERGIEYDGEPRPT